MQVTTNDENCDDNASTSVIDLKREIRKKTIRIYELEEKVETKESKIHELQLEKAKMRMTYDELRGEIEMLKDIEVKYNQMRTFSPNKSQKSVLIQTEGQDTSLEPLLPNTCDHNHLIPRHLTFTGAENSTHEFSLILNNSTDNLIPVESEILNLQNDMNQVDESATATTVETDSKKKSKKKFGLLKLMQCIKSKTQD